MRRAEWRQTSKEPPRGVGLLRTAALDALCLPPVQIVCSASLAGAFVFSLLFSLLLAASLLRKGSALGFVAIFLAVALVVFLMRVALKREGRPLDRRVKGLESLLPLPLPDHTFPVYVAIRFLGTLTALDVAAASFVEGWLHIDGRRASYAFHADEGRTEWRNGQSLRVDFSGGQSVSIWHIESPCSVGTQAYFSQRTRRGEKRERIGAPSIGNQAFFRHNASLWAADREHPEGESVLPPLGVYPTIRAERSALARAGVILPFGIAALVLLHGPYIAATWTIMAACLTATIANAYFFALSQRLDQADHRAKAFDRPHQSLSTDT